jgi:hypothetical protein
MSVPRCGDRLSTAPYLISSVTLSLCSRSLLLVAAYTFAESYALGLVYVGNLEGGIPPWSAPARGWGGQRALPVAPRLALGPFVSGIGAVRSRRPAEGVERRGLLSQWRALRGLQRGGGRRASDRARRAPDGLTQGPREVF